jgi:hypothetical protein
LGLIQQTPINLSHSYLAFFFFNLRWDISVTQMTWEILLLALTFVMWCLSFTWSSDSAYFLALHVLERKSRSLGDPRRRAQKTASEPSGGSRFAPGCGSPGTFCVSISFKKRKQKKQFWTFVCGRNEHWWPALTS